MKNEFRLQIPYLKLSKNGKVGAFMHCASTVYLLGM